MAKWKKKRYGSVFLSCNTYKSCSYKLILLSSSKDKWILNRYQPYHTPFHTMACINCQSRKVKCSYLQSNDCCDRCLAKQLRCEPHKSQQERRTDLYMEEESLTRSGHNASQSKREDSLDFDDTYCVVDVFSQWTRGLWYISNSDSTTLSYHPISSRVYTTGWGWEG